MSLQAGLAFSPPCARAALGVLFMINLFNYTDRQIIFGVFPLLQRDLALSDAALGALASAFMMLYMIASIPLGMLGDRCARNRLIAVGVAIWGAATFLSGLARSYGQLFVTRAAVGIGEASYGPTATAMVSDLFPKGRRGLVNGLFNAAIPLGGAIGVTLGGHVGDRFGWRAAFLVVGVPSLLLAGLAWRLGDPPRGASDRAAAPSLRGAALPTAGPPGLASGMLGLLRTPTFVIVCAVGMLVAFATGAFAAWLPTYLHRIKQFALVEATAWYGMISAGGGLIGVIAGGYLGDVLARRTPAGHLLTAAAGFILAGPFALLFLIHHDSRVFLPALFFAVLFLLLYVGSVNAVIHNVVHPSLRATAVAVFVFLIHLGGDALSPAIVGLISDRQSLQGAMLLLPVIVLCAGLITLAAASAVDGDMRRLERSLLAVSGGPGPRG